MLSRRSFHSLAISAWNRAATHTASSTRVQTSQTRNSSVGYFQFGRTTHHSLLPSGMQLVGTSVSTRLVSSAHEANAGGMPERGKCRKMMLRYECSPVWRPIQNGDDADRHSTCGTKYRATFIASIKK